MSSFTKLPSGSKFKSTCVPEVLSLKFCLVNTAEPDSRPLLLNVLSDTDIVNVGAFKGCILINVISFSINSKLFIWVCESKVLDPALKSEMITFFGSVWLSVNNNNPSNMLAPVM